MSVATASMEAELILHLLHLLFRQILRSRMIESFSLNVLHNYRVSILFNSLIDLLNVLSIQVNITFARYRSKLK